MPISYICRSVVAAVLAAGLCAAPARAGGLIGDWGFDEPDGQVVLDAGPYGLDGRLGESPTPDAADPERIPGASGGALRFAGGSFVRLPDSARTAPEEVSVEALVRAPESPGPYSYVLARGSYRCLAGSYGLYTGPGGGAAFYVFDGTHYHLTAAARPADVWDGEWHRITGSFQDGELRLSVDGRPVGEAARSSAQIDYGLTTTSSMHFGTYVSETCRRPFTGDVDEVRLWNGEPPAVPAGPPLPAAQPPSLVEAPATAGPAVSPPGAPPRACRLTAAARRRWVRVRMKVRGRPVRGVLVSLRRNGRPHARARTNARGRARLRIRSRRAARWRVHVVYSPRCRPARVR